MKITHDKEYTIKFISHGQGYIYFIRISSDILDVSGESIDDFIGLGIGHIKQMGNARGERYILHILGQSWTVEKAIK